MSPPAASRSQQHARLTYHNLVIRPFLIRPSLSLPTHTSVSMPLDFISKALMEIRVVKTVDVASLAILVYDYLLTLDLEMKYMWTRGHWSWIRFLFFVTRYTPLVDVPLSLFYQFTTLLDNHSCDLMYKYCAWSFILCMGMAEIILTIRTWTVWQHSRVVSVGLVLFYLGCWVPIFVTLHMFLATSHVLRIPISQYSTCFSLSRSRSLYICYSLHMVYAAGTMVLMFISALKNRRERLGSSFLKCFYRDGILYYVYLFALSVMNVTTILILPIDFVHLLTTFMRVLYSALACRSVLHLRDQATKGNIVSSGNRLYTERTVSSDDCQTLAA